MKRFPTRIAGESFASLGDSCADAFLAVVLIPCGPGCDFLAAASDVAGLNAPCAGEKW